MAHPILMPKPGQMTEECTLTAWHKQIGDRVRRGDVLFEIETDKSAMEVESFEEGVLLARLVEEGATVPVNAVCAYVGEPGETIPAAPSATAGASAAPTSPAAVPEPAVAAAAPTTRSQAATPPPEPFPAVPTSVASTSSEAADGGSARLRISPRASRLAAEAGIDLRAVIGTGPEGRIVERDVRVAMTVPALGATRDEPPMAAAAAPARVPPPGSASAVAPARAGDGDEPRPLSRMRRVIAERLTHSWTSTPHFTVTVAVDVSGLLSLRAELRQAGENLTVTDFVLSAVAQTLVEFPDVNASTDGVSVWGHRHVHLGLAVSLPAGLVVPVVRDAERLSVRDLHDRAAGLAAAARAGALTPDDMAGGTFTVSNLGMVGVEEFSAIINPGEAAILAVASAVPTPVVVGDAIVVRQVMKLTLSADHRIVDGETGARFLNAVRRRLEDAETFRREIATA